MLEVDVGTYLPDDLLAKVDIATMAHSLEARSPLLDHEFMELAASLPPQLKVRGRRRRSGSCAPPCAAGVPDAILDRPKQGFVVPIAEWLRTDLRDLAHDALLDPVARGRGWFRPEAVRNLLDRHLAGVEDRSGAIWALLMLELWQREVIERPPEPEARVAALA